MRQAALELMSRNPHDIGRRILQRVAIQQKYFGLVAILMTLEGEYYRQLQNALLAQLVESQSS